MLEGFISNQHICIQSAWRSDWNVFLWPIGRYVSYFFFINLKSGPRFGNYAGALAVLGIFGCFLGIHSEI